MKKRKKVKKQWTFKKETANYLWFTWGQWTYLVDRGFTYRKLYGSSSHWDLFPHEVEQLKPLYVAYLSLEVLKGVEV